MSTFDEERDELQELNDDERRQLSELPEDLRRLVRDEIIASKIRETDPNGRVQIDEYVLRYQSKLHEACNQADDRRIRRLVEARASINYLAGPNDWDNDLCAYSDSSCLAALCGTENPNLDTIKYLVEKGALYTNHGQQPPVFAATVAGNREVLEYLVKDLGAPIDELTQHGHTFAIECNWSALHWAICEGEVEMVRFLLNLGADPTVPDAMGRTPLQLAERSGVQDTIDIIREALSRRREEPCGGHDVVGPRSASSNT